MCIDKNYNYYYLHLFTSLFISLKLAKQKTRRRHKSNVVYMCGVKFVSSKCHHIYTGYDNFTICELLTYILLRKDTAHTHPYICTVVQTVLNCKVIEEKIKQYRFTYTRVLTISKKIKLCILFNFIHVFCFYFSFYPLSSLSSSSLWLLLCVFFPFTGRLYTWFFFIAGLNKSSRKTVILLLLLFVFLSLLSFQFLSF